MLSQSDIATCILLGGVWLVTPCCILTTGIYLGLTLIGNRLHINPVLVYYAYLELIYFVFTRYRIYRIRHAPAEQRSIPSMGSRKRVWEDIMGQMNGEGKKGMEKWLCDWFAPTPSSLTWVEQVYGWAVEQESIEEVKIGDIKRGNVEELLSGLFFHRSAAQIRAEPILHHSLTSMVFALEAKRNRRFESGHNAFIRPLPLCRTTTRSCLSHIPLLVYLSHALVNRLGCAILFIVGFQEYNQPVGLGYHYHPGWRNPGGGLACFLLRLLKRSQPHHQKATPIIVLHGLGGFTPLVPLIISLLSLNRPVYLVNQPHVSLRLSFGRTVPTMEEMVASIEHMLDQHSVKGDSGVRAMIVAHSLGSGLAAAVNCNTTGGDKYHTILVDPISIRLFDSHLTRELYFGNPSTPFIRVLRVMIGEAGVEQYLAKHFNPFAASLSVSSATGNGGRTEVILARNDPLIPVSAIQEDCRMAGVSCEVFENANHGSFVYNLPLFLRVMKRIKGVSEKLDTAHENATQLSTLPPTKGIVSVPKITVSEVLARSLSRSKSRIVSFDTMPTSAPCSTVARAGRSRSRTLGGCDSRFVWAMEHTHEGITA